MSEWLRDVPASKDEASTDFPTTDNLVRLVATHHPEYLRRSEHIFGNILSLYWGILKKKSVGGVFDLRSALAVILSKGYSALASGYVDKIRNAIAHGEVVFTGSGIRYGAAGIGLELTASDFLNELDTLWSTCNSLMIAFICFIRRSEGLSVIPYRISVLFAGVAGGHEGFRIDNVVESDYARMGRHLHLSVTSSFRSKTVA